MKIALIRTGDPSSVFRQTPSTREWEAYLDNANDLATALSELGHETIQLADGKGLVETLAGWRPDVSWVCSGGIQGRDPATHLPALLEMLGLDYIGSTPLAAGLADNKGKAKAIVRAAGIATPDFTVVPAGNVPVVSFVSAYPVMVKPVCGMCSCGLVRANSHSEVHAAVVALQHRYQDEVLIELFVAGIDVTVSIVQAADGTPICLPPLQRFFGDRGDPAFKHFELPHPKSQLREGPAIAAVLTDEQRASLLRAATAAFVALGLRHFARLDFRVSGSSTWFLEANHKPDLTRTSLFALSAKLAGLDYNEMVSEILRSIGSDRHPDGIMSRQGVSLSKTSAIRVGPGW